MAPPFTAQTAIIGEAAMNILSAIPMIFTPSFILKLAVANPRATITPLALTLARISGILLVVLTVPMLLAIPTSRRATQSRPGVYLTLGSGEVALIPLMLVLLGVGEEESGVKTAFALGGVSTLTPALVWRVWALRYGADWLEGREKKA